MSLGRNRLMRAVGVVVAVVAVALGASWLFQKEEEIHGNHNGASHTPRARLVAGEPNTIELPDDTVSVLEVKIEPVKPAPPPTPLKLSGSLFIDPNRLTRVHTRFAGEVTEIGMVERGMGNNVANRDDLHIHFGDQVKKDQLLAVIWSKDLGEKKSELVDALSRLFLDQETLARLKPLYDKGSIPERSLREQERLVEADRIAVDRADQTLRASHVPEAEIGDVRAEAARIHRQRGNPEEDRTQAVEDRRLSWPRVELRAAIDGTIVEKNINVGEFVGTDLDLFQIANLTRLDVLAHAFEEDLELLEDLQPEQRHWKVYLKADPQARPLVGSFSQIGRIIDPAQHAALVMGWVDNSGGRLRVGQFISAVVELPANPDEVAVPASALVDDDGETFIFVQPDPSHNRFRLRHVVPTRRHDDLVYIAASLSPEQRASGHEPLTAGEWIVSSGCLEMARELSDLAAGSQVAKK